MSRAWVLEIVSLKPFKTQINDVVFKLKRDLIEILRRVSVDGVCVRMSLKLEIVSIVYE